jgi:hypothetical protein
MTLPTNLLVYSNSCSFGAPGQGHTIYPEIISKNLTAQLINRGKGGSCNRRIIRTTLRDLTELEKKHRNILVLIGLTFISRTELWQPWLPATDNDGHFSSITINSDKIDWSISGLINTIVPDIDNYTDTRLREYYKQWLNHYNPESEIPNLLTDLIMFTGWAKNNNINYCIFSNVDVLPGDDKVDCDSPFIRSLRNEIESDPCVINLWNFSFGGYALNHGLKPKDYNRYKHHGHPGEEAHTLFANFLLTHLQNKSLLKIYQTL